jgi:peptidyl-prolyl cis-trans isomerase D
VLGPDQLAAGIEVPEADIAAAFAARRGEFEQPETRDIDQLLLPDEATAGVLLAQWQLGATWETMAERAREGGGSAVQLGRLARAAIPIAPVADAAFALAASGTAGPVQTPFGFSILRVNRIEPGRAATLDDVRERLRAELARERAVDLVYARERRAEDSLAAGTPLAEVAREFGMALVQISAIDREGRDASGLAVDLGAAQPVGAKLLDAAFAVSPSAEPRMIEAEGGVFFAVKVEGVTPAATKPFETVQDAVLAAWSEDARRRAAEAKATQLMTAARAEGASLAAAAEAEGVAIRQSGAIQRPGPQAPRAEVPPELANALFGLAAPGQVTMVRVPGGYAVLALAEVRPAAPDEATIAAFRGRISQAVGEDVEQVFVDQLRTRAGVTLVPRGLELLAQP